MKNKITIKQKKNKTVASEEKSVFFIFIFYFGLISIIDY